MSTFKQKEVVASKTKNIKKRNLEISWVVATGCTCRGGGSGLANVIGFLPPSQ